MAYHDPRPLSPHLSAWRFTVTMACSITHRIAGVGVYAGLFILGGWLFMAMLGEASFAGIQAFFSSWFGTLVLVGFSWATSFYILAEMRDWAFAAGYGYDKDKATQIAWAVYAGSLALTALFWILVFVIR